MLLGARQFFERRGASAPTARDYVQNSLIAMWDGIENTGYGTHSDSATSWIDLVGSRNLAIASGTIWESNCLWTNGVARAATWTNANNFVDSIFCAEAVFKFAELYTAASTAIHIRASTQTGKYVLAQAYRSGGRMNLAVARISSSTLDTTIHSASANFTNRTTDVYGWLDGSALTYLANWGQSETTNMICVGSNGNGTEVCNFRLYCLRLYGRSLTESERQSNLAVDIARYNTSGGNS